ncbi:MAG: Holliday junction resolvase RuvX [bacterium]
MTVLGIDYGSVRVGLAISDERGRLAVPSETLTPKSESELLFTIQQIVREKGVGKIVVGLPLALSGRETEQTRQTLQFIQGLQTRLSIPVETEDERLTSVEAARGGVDASTKDARAAALLLQNYLDRTAQRP